MKKTLFLFSVIIFLFSNFGLKAQRLDSISRSPLLLGFGAGMTTGFGLTYRNVPYKLGVQFSIGSIYNDFSVGITPIYMVTRDKIANLFIYNGNDYYRFDSAKNRFMLANGIGFGLDINTETPFVFSFMIGAASYTYSDDKWRSGITGEVALFYKIDRRTKNK